MNEHLIGVLFLIIGVVLLFRGFTMSKPAMAGLKARAIITGFLLIIAGLVFVIK